MLTFGHISPSHCRRSFSPGTGSHRRPHDIDANKARTTIAYFFSIYNPPSTLRSNSSQAYVADCAKTKMAASTADNAVNFITIFSALFSRRCFHVPCACKQKPRQTVRSGGAMQPKGWASYQSTRQFTRPLCAELGFSLRDAHAQLWPHCPSRKDSQRRHIG